MADVSVDLFSVTSPEDGRFPPGCVLGQRYRIGGRLGRGGMGEVYKAFDLVLGQTVALKFLRVTSDGALERFRNEVRLARQVSHPNVCRVYDIGKIEGAPFLSMEYVDGEDLASLLRRIGRVPSDKALDIARRLCAGLAAAHDKGVLHRDLKPANVMINGRGEVLITDFGLAAMNGNVPTGKERQGTPAYMSPEQLAGTEVTPKSDIYALGLLLYEIFTGKRAFDAASASEFARMQRESTPASLTHIAKDVDPAVESVIQRCLAPDPRNRPASAKVVALALLGCDPLAAAVAAGETPSPEVVANAGESEGLSPARALGLLLATVLILAALPAMQLLFHLSPSLLDHTPSPNSPEALATLAHEYAARLGYLMRPAHSAYGMEYNQTWLDQLRQQYGPRERRALLAGGRPAPIGFWYRQSPVPLDPGAHFRVTMTQPPFETAEMVRMRLDMQGRLLQFEAVPERTDAEDLAQTSPRWDALFAAAGLDRAKFTAVAPQWRPTVACDTRAAWTGAWPEVEKIAIRIEAAAWHGRPVSFRILEPWMKSGDGFAPAIDPAKGSSVFSILCFCLFVPAAVFLAYRNVRLKRGDRRGAARIAAALFTIEFAGFLLSFDHTAGGGEVELLWLSLALAVLYGAAVYAVYLALEPYIRRRWPHTLIAWTRLTEGRLRDPVVGSHVLAGTAAGAAILTILWLTYVIALPFDTPFTDSLDPLRGSRFFAGSLLMSCGMFYLGLLLFFIFFLFRALLRRDWAARVVFLVLMVALFQSGGHLPAVQIIAGILYFGGLLTVLLRYGLLAACVSLLVLNWTAVPITFDPSRWDFGYSLTIVLTILALSAYGCWAALAGRPLWNEDH